jgi:hypothetical protein
MVGRELPGRSSSNANFDRRKGLRVANQSMEKLGMRSHQVVPRLPGPALEHCIHFVVQGLDSRLQQEMRTSLAPLLLSFPNTRYC